MLLNLLDSVGTSLPLLWLMVRRIAGASPCCSLRFLNQGGRSSLSCSCSIIRFDCAQPEKQKKMCCETVFQITCSEPVILRPWQTLSRSPTPPLSLAMQHFLLPSTSPQSFYEFASGGSAVRPHQAPSSKHFEALPGGKLVTWRPEEGAWSVRAVVRLYRRVFSQTV